MVTSELTLAECIVRPVAEKDHDTLDRYEHLLSGDDVIETHQVAWAILHMAGILRGQNRALRTPDAIHIATAITHGCEMMLTGDKRLRAEYTFYFKFELGPRHWSVGPHGLKIVNVHAADQSPFNGLLAMEYKR